MIAVLEIVQRVCGRINLPRPNAAVGSQDAQILQLVGLLNKLPEDLATRRTEWFGVQWIASDTGTAKGFVTADTDRFPDLIDAIPLNFLEWRWKSEKGLDYAEAFLLYERLIGMMIARIAAARGEIDVSKCGGGGYDLQNINQGLVRRCRY